MLSLLLLSVLAAVASAQNTIIFKDYTFGYSVVLPSTSFTNTDDHIYNSAVAGTFSFGLDWNGDAGDSYTFLLQPNAANQGTLSFNTTDMSMFCTNATLTPSAAVTFGPNTITQCNYTGTYNNFFGTLSIDYNNGEVTETIDVSFRPSIMVGDPQFVGLRGQSYQVHGIDGAVYNLVSEQSTQVNSRFVFLTQGVCPTIDGAKDVNCWSHPGSYMGEVSFQAVVDGKLHAALVQSGPASKGFAGVQVDGKALKVGDKVVLGDFSVELLSAYSVAVQTESFDFALSNSDMFINQALRVRVPLSQLKSHGLIGQTHSSKTYSTAIKYIEGEVDDYVIADSDIFGTDFAFNRFQQ